MRVDKIEPDRRVATQETEHGTKISTGREYTANFRNHRVAWMEDSVPVGAFLPRDGGKFRVTPEPGVRGRKPGDRGDNGGRETARLEHLVQPFPDENALAWLYGVREQVGQRQDIHSKRCRDNQAAGCCWPAARNPSNINSAHRMALWSRLPR